MEQFWELGALDEAMVNLISNIEYKALTPQQAADKLVKELAEEIERNR